MRPPDLGSLNTVVMGSALALATAGCSGQQATPHAPPRAVRVAAATSATEPGGVRYSATIQPNQQVPLAFRAGGYVESIASRRGNDGHVRPLQPGDAVARGTVVARVRDAEYRERLAQARSRRAEAESALLKAKQDHERASTLFAQSSLTRPDLDAAQAQFEGSRARVTAAAADVALADLSLADTALVAPSDSVVLERRIETGSLVAAGTVGFVLEDVRMVKAVFGVPDLIVQRLERGTPLVVITEAWPGVEFTGQVSAIAPAADPQSRVFNVEVSVPNRDGRLRAGMIATVRVPGSQAASVDSVSGPVVPLTAIVRPASGSGYGVFLVDGAGDVGAARLRAVTLGDVRGNGVSVASGLRVGDRVVVTGAGLLHDGDRVRVVP